MGVLSRPLRGASTKKNLNLFNFGKGWEEWSMWNRDYIRCDAKKKYQNLDEKCI